MPVPRHRSDFTRLYEDQVASVYGFLAYRLGAQDLAEDLTQATFERALRSFSRYDPRRASERTWLLTIARNLLTDHYRRSASAPSEQLHERDHPATPGPELKFAASPELHAALESLSNREREVIALRFGADMTGAEIAELLDLSLSNVQQVLSRTLRRLRIALDSSEAATAPGPAQSAG